MASKTRERLLEVAHQLFASNGVERTTMNDIATASDKGRRTIYTYFKNKREIYEASSTTSQLLSYITLDYKRLERIRVLAVAKEQELIKQMIDEGVAKGIFDPRQARLLPEVYQMIFQGIDYCHLRGSFNQLGITPAGIRESVINFVINTLLLKSTII